MQRTVYRSLQKQATMLALLTALATAATSQVPPTPGPAATMAPLGQSPTPAADGGSQAFEPVRQAIGRQDYTAARAALEQVRKIEPNHPGIALYESMIERRQTQGQTLGEQSPLRTPRPGVTPAPTPVPTATPVPTPMATPVAAATPASASGVAGMQAKAKELSKNPIALYGAIGVAALIIIGIIMMLLKRKRRAELEAPIAGAGTPGGISTMGGMDDFGLGQPGGSDAYGLGGGAGLSSAPLSTDYTSMTPSANAYGGTEETPLAGGSSLAGSSLSGAMGNYSMPTFGTDEEEEEAPRPKPIMRSKPVEDEGPVNIFGDEPPAAAPAPAAVEPAFPEPHEPTAGLVSDSASFESLGINFGGESTPSAPAGLSKLGPAEETVIVPPSTSKSSNATPASSPSISPGTVDLEDIFGSQPVPGSTADEDANSDANSHTLPTFVATPGAENPEDSVERKAAQNQRRPENKESETQSISFDELFGAPDASSASTPAAVEPVADLPPAHAVGDMSIEDALAATIGDMSSEKPFDQQPTVIQPPEPEGGSAESLDERSERMFREQMEKARQAVGDKNWRQAVHFLSIASALHPENDEARQMLKEARTEKRKAEESV